MHIYVCVSTRSGSTMGDVARQIQRMKHKLCTNFNEIGVFASSAHLMLYRALHSLAADYLSSSGQPCRSFIIYRQRLAPLFQCPLKRHRTCSQTIVLRVCFHLGTSDHSIRTKHKWEWAACTLVRTNFGILVSRGLFTAIYWYIFHYKSFASL